MSTIVFPRPMPPQPVASQAVAYRLTWDSPWIALPRLHCTRLALATGESLSAASFQWGVGPYLPPDSPVWEVQGQLVVNPLTYVRVVTTGSAGRVGYDWAGVWRRAELHERRQRFDAVGLESLLDTPCVDSPWIDAGTLRFARRGLEFNQDGLPNRSGGKHEVNGVECYVFDPLGVGSAEYWSTRDAVEMLLAMGAPLDPDGDPAWNWGLSNLAALPDYDRVRMPTHGRAYLGLLRTLVPRHRLIGWCCEIGPGGDPQIRFFTFAAAPISLTDVDGNPVGTIPANDLPFTLDVEYDAGGQSSFVTEASHVADQVVVTGDRRQVVFTLSKLDATLGAQWTLAEQAEYNAGASNDPNYPALPDRKRQQEWDRNARAVDKLRHVYTEFGPLLSWTQQAGDGEGGAALLAIVLDEDDEPIRQYLPAVRFLPQLPLLRGYDYSADKIQVANAADPPPAHRAEEIGEGPFEPLPLLGFVRVWMDPEPVDPAPDRWIVADQMGRAGDLEQEDEGTNRRWSASVRPSRDALTLEIRVVGEQQHVIARVEMLGHKDWVSGSIDWQNDLVVTVAIEETRDLEARYPADGDVVPLGERLRVKRLEAPGFRHATVRPNTVVAVDQDTGVLVRSTTGGVIVDDSAELHLLAQRLYQWHRIPRYAVGLGTHWIDGLIQIGRLLTAIADINGTAPNNTIVSEITLEFPITEGERPQLPRATLTTAFAEMDPQRIV